MRDMHHNISPVVAFQTTAIGSDTTTGGKVVDLQGFDSVEFVIQSGALTDGTYTPLVEEGDQSDLSDASAVADADLLGTESDAAFADTDDNAVKRIGYRGGKRYVRLSVVSASTTTGGTISAVALRGHAGDVPTT